VKYGIIPFRLLVTEDAWSSNLVSFRDSCWDLPLGKANPNSSPLLLTRFELKSEILDLTSFRVYGCFYTRAHKYASAPRIASAV